MNINDIRKLLSEKEKNLTNTSDKEKIENLKILLKEDDIFFKVDIHTALGILEFLGIKEENMKDVYMSLIQPSQYIDSSKPYVSISNRT